jgi:hypothetical protein
MKDLVIQIRLATKDDLEEITKLHCASFAPLDHVPVMLGKRYVKATYRWQITNKKAYTLAATLDGKIVGVVAVCDGPFTKLMFIACLPEFIISLLLNPKLILNNKLWKRLLRKPQKINDIDNNIDKDGLAQMTIGVVDSAYRGKGIFPLLVEATKTYSLNRGSKGIRAGIYKNNTSSRNVFVKGGWVLSPELETDDTVFYITILK